MMADIDVQELANGGVPLNLEGPHSMEDLYAQVAMKPIHTFIEQGFLSATPEEHREAYDRARKKFLQDRYYEMLNTKFYSGEITVTPANQSIMDAMMMAAAVKKNEVWWITISPEQVYDVPAFIKCIHKYATSKAYRYARYCFETRTDDSTCGGLHVHMYCETSDPIPKSVVQQRIKQAVSKFGRFNLKLEALACPKKIANTVAYVGKVKHSDDGVFRQKYGLKDVYENGSSTYAAPATLEEGAGAEPTSSSPGDEAR